LNIDLGKGYFTTEQYAQAILQRLGLTAVGTPRGIGESIRRVRDLEHGLAHARGFGEVTAIITSAAREYEGILRDLACFYGQVLYGRFYGRSLARLARKRLADSKRDLTRATLGDLIAILEVLNGHLQSDSPEARHFRKIFGRPFAVPPKLLANSRVTAVRNRFAHNHDDLAQSSPHQVAETARPVVEEVLRFLQEVEASQIYPRIVAVESFVTDCFGRKYMICRNDQGNQEKVFTNVTVDPSRRYFFYPTTNPTRIHPIIVPV
jgi:hypothetical protein